MFSSKNLLVACTLGYTPSSVINWAKTAIAAIKDADIVILTDRDEREYSVYGFSRIIFKRVDANSVSRLNIHRSFLGRRLRVAPHVARFIHISEFLQSSRHEFIVTTDIRDVVFQSDPFESLYCYLNSKSLIISGEGIQYKDEEWGKRNFIECFGDRVFSKYSGYEALNVGVLAGKRHAIASLCEQVSIFSLGRPIPIVDQAVFNFLARSDLYQQSSVFLTMDTPWACHLGTTNDPRISDQYNQKLIVRAPIIKDGRICTSDGAPFAIVHQYDRCDQLQKQMIILA